MSCRAIIQEGVRKGEPCKFPPQGDGYCGRHKRNKEYDTLVATGKHPCRQFFRGCNNCVEVCGIACTTCRDKLSGKSVSCDHDGCKNKVKESGYCGKHYRDVYRVREKKEGIRFCDIERGCFNVCDNRYASCTACLKKCNAADKKRYHSIKTTNAIAATNNMSLCCYCGKTFETFLTRYNKQSQSCRSCSAIQKKSDDKRSARVRNYAAERKKNIECAIKKYKKNATKRKLDFTLTQDEFTTFVSSPCYYCGKYNENEVIGIDRINSDKGYMLENVAPCCWPCNRMKSDYDQEFFYDHCSSIYTHTSPKSHGSKWVSYFARVKKSYNNYKSRCADKRKLEFTLTPYEYQMLQNQPCYICGYKQTHVGLDRIDSSKGYTTENTRPCCPPCNYMKCDMTLDAFMNHIDAIIKHNAKI
jgi:hypothetical protein